MRADVAATSHGSSDSAAARPTAAMPASVSMRSFSRDTSACLELTLSYTVWADARRLGDVAHARAGVPALGEQPSRGSEDRVPRELRPPFSQARGVLRHGLGTPDLTSVPVGGRAGGRLGLGAPRWVVEHRSAGGGLTVAALGCFVGCDGFLEHDDGCPPDR
jgi:hypothetical protein